MGHYWRASSILRKAQKNDPRYVRRRLKPERIRQELQQESQRKPDDAFLGQLVSFVQGQTQDGSTTMVQPPEVASIVEAVSEHFGQLKTFSARVVRTSRSPEGSARQEWKVLLEFPEKIRVDWLGQQPMTFVCSGTEAWYYMPKEKKAVHVKEVDNESMPKMDLGLNVLPNYVQTHRFQLSSDAPEGQWYLKGVSDAEADVVREVRLWIDKESKCLLKSELYDRQGRLKVRTQYSKIRDSGTGLKLPGKCSILSYTDGGELEVEMTFLEMSANVLIREEDFQFVPLKGVVVEDQ